MVWDKKKKEAKCKNNTYVSAVEHADDFFKRIWLEMNKRSENIENQVTVFIGDGAPWIWNRVIDLANEKSILILDFYHACEHLAKICKDLYREETENFWDSYKNWKELLYAGKVNKVIEQLRQIMKTVRKQSILESLLGEIKYFEDNKCRMEYDKYKKMKLPIGSGTTSECL